MGHSILKQLKIKDLNVLYEEIPDFDEQLLEKIEQGLEEHECPFYGEVWPAAFQLCHSLLDISLENKKTIELGCGLAIPSIIASIKGAQASACDHNPDAQELVIKNSQHNHTEVAFHCIDWTRNYDLKPEYDLLMASDILYRPEQFSHIVKMFESLSKEDSTILITDPGRVKREDFVGMMNHRFKLIQEVKAGDIWVMKWSKKKKK